MRLPLAVSLESRDGGVTKDCVVKNGIVESRGQDVPAILRKRPGLSNLQLIAAGTAQALAYWSGKAVTVIGDTLYYGISTGYTHSTTWSPTDQSAHVTLSNGNLTATLNCSSSQNAAVRSIGSIASGIWYVEHTLGSIGGLLAAGWVGIGNASLSLTAVPGSTANSLVVEYFGNSSNALAWYNNSSTSIGVKLTVGDVLGVLVDRDAGTCKFYKNGTLAYTASTIPAGALYAVAAQSENASFSTVTNFGATAFTYQSVVSGSSSSLSPTTTGLQFTLQDNGSNSPSSQLMIKNASQAWTLTSGGTLTQITDTDYPGTYSVTLTSLTRSGTVATATTAVDTNFQVGSTVVIAGATPSTYNGSQVITGITPSKTAESADIAITITRSGTTATATTVSEPHGYTNGQTVTISGSDQAEYNGAKTITWISATSFSFTVTVTTGQTASATTATGTPIVAKMEHRISAIQGSYWSGGTAGYLRFYCSTVTVSNGDTVTFAGIPGLPDGSYTAANVTATYFEIALPSGVTDGYSNLNSIYWFSRLAVTLSSITRSGTTFTFTFALNHHITSDARDTRITISGATESIFNGLFYVGSTTTTVASGYYVDGARNNQLITTGTPDSPATPATGTIIANSNSTTAVGASFTFSISGSPVTPATGTITATGGRNTVPGIAYLDGYFCVMDIYGVIYNSAEDDPSTWNALEFVTALAETGAGKAISRSLNYIVAFKEWSTELWYNAAKEPPGSPLGPVDDGLILVGCASGDSVVRAGEGLLFWISQTREKGRGVHLMQGRQPSKISTPDVDRILAADDLATVRALSLRVDGHQLYLLTLETSNITLCYDLQSQSWTQWSSYTLNGSSVSVSSITRSDTTATVTTSTAHGLSDGDPVKMAGANQSDYNGIFQAFVVSSTVFTIEVANSPTTPATGTITATPYTESYFKFTKYADANGADVLLHETDGHLYQMLSTLYQDAGIPINRFCRSTRLDGGSDAWKTMPAIRLVGDAGTAKVALRWSDDDCATFVAYRTLDMSLEKPETRRCGKFRRRTLAFRDIGNTAERWEAAEIDIGGQ